MTEGDPSVPHPPYGAPPGVAPRRPQRWLWISLTAVLLVLALCTARR